MCLVERDEDEDLDSFIHSIHSLRLTSGEKIICEVSLLAISFSLSDFLV